MTIKIKHIKIEFSGHFSIEADHLLVGENHRIGLIGANGSGKTTLMKAIEKATHHFNPHLEVSGTIAYYPQLHISFFPLSNHLDLRILNLLHVSDVLEQEVHSGGEKAKIHLTKILSEPAHHLLLDEPTSHLDQESIDQFIKELAAFPSYIIASHDRLLLNHCCNVIWAIENGRVRVFNGNYEAYIKQKQLEEKAHQDAYQRYSDEKKRLQSVYREKMKQSQKMVTKKGATKEHKLKDFLSSRPSSTREKSMAKQAKSVLARIEHLEVVEKPKEVKPIKIDFSLTAPPRNKVVLSSDCFNFAYDEKVIFKDFSFYIENGEHVGLVGRNGSGKTTLIQQIIEHHPKIHIVPQAKLGYLSQNLSELDLSLSVYENILKDSVQDVSVLRTILDRMLFNRETIDKPSSILSGGERVKLAIAKLLVKDYNILLLDEPSNYLDLDSLEAIENILAAYEGTLLLITHDQTLMDRIVTRKIILV